MIPGTKKMIPGPDKGGTLRKGQFREHPYITDVLWFLGKV